MVGMKVVVIKCDEHGNVDIEDLKEKTKKDFNKIKKAFGEEGLKIDKKSLMLITEKETSRSSHTKIVFLIILIFMWPRHFGEITCSGPTCRAIPAWYCPTALIKKVHSPVSVLWVICTKMAK